MGVRAKPKAKTAAKAPVDARSEFALLMAAGPPQWPLAGTSTDPWIQALVKAGVVAVDASLNGGVRAVRLDGQHHLIDTWLAARSALQPLGMLAVLLDDFNEWFALREALEKPAQAKPRPAAKLGSRAKTAAFQPPWRGKPLLAALPTAEPWRAASVLGFGALKALPRPEAHVAHHRRWFEAFGAEPVAFGLDWLTLMVPRPPNNAKEVERVAREHSAYAPALAADFDSRSQSQRHAALAKRVRANCWTFAWDV